MLRLIIGFSLACTGCGTAEQPKWGKTVAAYEVPLPTAQDKVRFIALLTKEAERAGFHVDAATPDDLAAQSQVSRITLNVTVWRGEDDEESIASAMDFEDRIGRVWLSFSLGQSPQRSARFRDALLPKIKRVWPETASLPIMPNGAIPLTDDLVRTRSGYVVKSSAAVKYQGEDRRQSSNP